MTLFYCMSNDTSIRAIFQLIKSDGKWHIRKIVEADNGELIKRAVGVFSTKTAAIEWMIEGCKTVIRIE